MNFFILSYYNRYPHEKDTSGVWTGFAALLGGPIGCIMIGYLSDRLENEYKIVRAKSYIGIATSLIAVPILLTEFLINDCFVASVFMLFLYWLLSDGFVAPCLAMIQYCIDVKYKTIAIGMFFFGQSISAIAVSWLLGDVIGKAAET